MNSDILAHYRQFSTFTNPGPYMDMLAGELPDDVREIGELVRRQIIHRVTLFNGNTGSNADLRYGDMTKVPWWRQAEDDILPTASAMLAELYRRDNRGFVCNRSEENKLIVTCRFVAILMASILKAKGKSARVRSGFDPYASPRTGTSCDHWITQYWETTHERWITIDVDCCLEDLQFDPFDMPSDVFDWSADAWLSVRDGKAYPQRFWNAGGFEGLMPIAWGLYYDLHCLMNNEIIYLHCPEHVRIGNFDNLSTRELTKIDELAQLMLQPDDNFYVLRKMWESTKDVRLLAGALL
ncbi:MAG: hypothetical protein HY711_01615 [Candidatus Melainabacteria bacterium]|nr:hypothetical protein [Candidatus Melainabacteria bacterium]